MITVVIVDDKPVFRVQPGQLPSRAGPTADDLDLNVVRLGTDHSKEKSGERRCAWSAPVSTAFIIGGEP
jgi:hypothetical protein